MRDGELFIDGEWVKPQRRPDASPTIDPSTEEPIGEVARGEAADVDRAVRARRSRAARPVARR